MSTQQDFRPETYGPSIGTIVWGAVVIVVGAFMLANRLGWFSIDPGYAAAGILLVAGLALVVGGIAASRRRHVLTHDGAAATSGGDLTGAPTTADAYAETRRPSPYDSSAGQTGTRNPPATD
ncbi:hypothetical protein [Sinomonas sp. P10A9]|uniref:LPXTG-motif cell wall-anchored protein n=1 Tax=Sinomonas puerhi TaxID=3238584 RepID=A0AB39L0U5_9MICC